MAKVVKAKKKNKRAGTFSPGISGNPKGRPRKMSPIYGAPSFRDLADEDKGIGFLKDDSSLCRRAAEYLIDSGNEASAIDPSSLMQPDKQHGTAGEAEACSDSG